MPHKPRKCPRPSRLVVYHGNSSIFKEPVFQFTEKLLFVSYVVADISHEHEIELLLGISVRKFSHLVAEYVVPSFGFGLVPQHFYPFGVDVEGMYSTRLECKPSGKISSARSYVGDYASAFDIKCVYYLVRFAFSGSRPSVKHFSSYHNFHGVISLVFLMFLMIMSI